MARSFCTIFMLALLLCGSTAVLAQTKPGNYPFDYLPREKVLFEDDFNQDTIGNFPAHWHYLACMDKNVSAEKRVCTVDTDGLENALVIPAFSEPHIEPNLAATRTLLDIYTMELDFLPGASQENQVTLEFQLAEKVGECRSAYVSVSQYGMLHFSTTYPKLAEVKVPYPGYFQQGVYHHLALSYFKGAFNCYIDDRHVISFPNCGFAPIKYSLGFKGPIRIREFRVANGKEISEFYKLTPAKSLTTHSFQFAEGKSTLTPVSLRYVQYLARFLKENPSMVLEINGHTDNVGDPSINKRLSQVRADELKKQLVLAGIDTKRLTTRGWGDTKPLKSNDSPESRYDNARIELIKQ